MTPEVVLHRYLQLVNTDDVGIAGFVELLGTDADLLTRWLRVLNCPASPECLRDGLAALEPWTFTDVAQAQAWSVLPPGGSMRLGFDQWRSVLKSALLGEILGEHLAMPDPLSLRWRLHLAMSGVKLDADPQLEELIEFRGARMELLEDAPLAHRILAVLDALELQEESSVAAAAERLLNIDAYAFGGLVAQASERCTRLLHQVGLLDADDGCETTDELWNLQQVNLLAGLFLQGGNHANIFAAHELAGKTLFRITPALFMRDGADDTLLAADGTQDIPLSSASSRIALALREGREQRLYDGADCPIADRQVLKRLPAEEGLAVPLIVQGEGVGALVFAVDHEIEQGHLLATYANALARWLGAAEHAEQGPNELTVFREMEEKRLRELVHEVNNPLSIVNNYLHILELKLQDEASATEQLAIIGRELHRAAELLQIARDVPRSIAVEEPRASVTNSEFDINELVRQVHEIHLGYARERDCHLGVNLQATPLLLVSDENRVTQILNNLLKNALEAGEGTERVSLTTRGGVYREGQRGVEVCIADDGPGLPLAVLDKLYEPKQSTKGGDHSGLGLHIVHGLVQDIGASIDLRTARGEGTEFTLFLPLQPRGSA